jgi:Ca2+-binding RTX toxin-like protein
MTNDILTMARLSLAAYNNTLSTKDGFAPISATTFGIERASGQGNSVDWTFANGVYKASVPGRIANTFDDRAVANVYLATGANGEKTLAIAFRGTDGNTLDKALGWGPQMKSGYYPLFDPLIDAVKAYAATNDVAKVLITGHSLGAAMAQYAMRDLANTGDTKYEAAIFGSPGAANSGNRDDDRMIEFQYSDDIFGELEDAPLIDFDHQGQRVIMPLDSTTTNKDDNSGFYEHEMNLYLKAMQNFTNLGSQAPAFLNASRFDGGVTTRTYAGTTGNDSLRGEKKSEALYGGAGNDALDARNGNDRIYGGSGNDRIDGGEGTDTLYGNAGLDRFIFDERLTSANTDTIRDFSVVSDAIWLNDSIFKNLDRGELDDSAFHNGARATDASDRIVYNKSQGTLAYDSDGEGGSAARIFAKVTAGLDLNSDDFWVY